MRPTQHIIISGAAGGLLAIILNSWLAGLTCFVSGVLIDLDHVVDYGIEKKQWPFDYNKLCAYCHFDKKGKLFLIFHAIEYVFILLLIALTQSHSVFWGLFCGIGLHIGCDLIFNPFRPWGYFITYRIAKNFERKYIFTQDYVQKVLQIS